VVLVVISTANPIRYESEDAHLIGGAHFAQDFKGYSGRGFVNFEDQGGSLIFSINIPHDALYPFSIAYSSMHADISMVSVRVNGIEKVVRLSPSNGWSTHVESIAFRQGLNSVVMMADSLAVASIDFVEIKGAIPLAAQGATLPYFEIEAENAVYNGVLIGPSRDLYMVPTEASGRLAVQINKGQYVEFTLTASANALTVRFSIPDTPNGSGQVAYLDVLVDGTWAFNLTVTSIFSWAYGDYPFTKNPGDGKPHHFYDETRSMFGKTINAGSKVRVVALNPITYTIDLADFYTVPSPYAMPSGFLSVTDNGADPMGKKDSTAAFNATITAAQTQNKGVWIPQGLFLVTTRFTLNKVTVRGAGPWYSTVQATVPHGVGFFGNWAPNPSVDVQLFDFAILGDTNVRVDSAVDSGVGGAFNGNSLAQNLWIEHTKCGMWLDGPFSGLHITGLIIRNTYADGINLHLGISNVVVEQTILRNVGDDALAIWSEKQADINNTFKFNTIQVPVLANGIALYGGTDNSATDNYVADSICDGGGLQVGNRYDAIPIAGATTFARNTQVRCGAPSRFGPQDCGSIWAWQSQGSFGGVVTFQDNVAINSSYAAFTFWDGTYNGNLVVNGLTVINGPYVMEVNSAGGTIAVSNVVATGTLDYGGIHSCAGLIFNDKGGNMGWNMSHDTQHCN
jgi:hypothetical protein